MALANYLEMVLIFAFANRVLASWFPADQDEVDVLTLGGALSGGLAAASTFGQVPHPAPDSPGVWVLLAESSVGLFMTLVVLARFISILPSRKELGRGRRG